MNNLNHNLDHDSDQYIQYVKYNNGGWYGQYVPYAGAGGSVIVPITRTMPQIYENYDNPTYNNQIVDNNYRNFNDAYYPSVKYYPGFNTGRYINANNVNLAFVI